MTQSETEFGTWRDKLIKVNDPTDEPLHYELVSPAGERRLREFVTTTSADDRDTDASDPPLFEVDPQAATQKRRYRYRGPDDVNLWCALAFEIVAIRGQQVDTGENGNYTFLVGFRLSADDEDNNAIRGSERLADRVTVDLGDIEEDYRPVREFRVAGLPDQREANKEFLRLDRGRWGLDPEHGLLLEGPPVTGKTEPVMEVCREQYGSVPVEISGP
ncbi:hypothetical protein [Halorientalis persicus]|nr:hypothetical protein [Halorientalis persicus]